MEFIIKREPTIKEVFYILKNKWMLNNDDVNLSENDKEFKDIGEMYRLNFCTYMMPDSEGEFDHLEISEMVDCFYMEDVSIKMLFDAWNYLVKVGCLERSAGKSVNLKNGNCNIQNVNRWAYLFDNWQPIMLGIAIALAFNVIVTMFENVIVKIALIIHGG